jgi:hypothetical protein
VFFLAAVLMILMAAVYLIINLIRGDREFPFMFAGYRMDVSAMAGAHVWPMEDVVDGKRIRSLSGLEDPGIPERLAEAGMERIWVTPVIPFLIPIAIAFALIIFVGNPLFAFSPPGFNLCMNGLYLLLVLCLTAFQDRFLQLFVHGITPANQSGSGPTGLMACSRTMAVSYHGGAAENRTGSEKYISIFLQGKKKNVACLLKT